MSSSTSTTKEISDELAPDLLPLLSRALKLPVTATIHHPNLIQELWGGYGHVWRVRVSFSEEGEQLEEEKEKHPLPVDNAIGDTAAAECCCDDKIDKKKMMTLETTTTTTTTAYTVIVKQINPPSSALHDCPAHQRKMTSFVVEEQWYLKHNEALRDLAEDVGLRCFTCHMLADLSSSSISRNEPATTYSADACSDSLLRGTLLLLEDLDQIGFSGRRERGAVPHEEGLMCLEWIAHLHAAYLRTRKPRRCHRAAVCESEAKPSQNSLKEEDNEEVPASVCWENLWDQGSYWYLDTRQKEWERMEEENPLKLHAKSLDTKLRSSKFCTLLHGDPKIANFCFPTRDVKSGQMSPRPASTRHNINKERTQTTTSTTSLNCVTGNDCRPGVAGLDFQYIGGGPPVRDAAYLIYYLLVPTNPQHAYDDKMLAAKITVEAAESLLERYVEFLRDGLYRVLTRCDKDNREAEMTLRSGILPELRINSGDVDAIIAEVRSLFPIAWLDFQRFFSGWKQLPFDKLDPITKTYAQLHL